MPRVAFVFRTDTHVADRSPVSWKGDYPGEIWSNLEQIGKLAKEHEAQAVLDGGDYFHVKSASRNSHSLVVRSASIQKAYPCPTFCVEGNHDIAYNNLETLDRQPLGVLYESGVFQHLRESIFEDGKLRVRVVGVPYSGLRTLTELQAIKKRPGDTFLIAVVHALAGESPPPKVEEFFGEPVFRYSELASEDGPDVWCFGHWHKDQGIVTVAGKQFVNHGAVSRGALSHENIHRVPKVALLEATLDGFRISALPLQVAPAEDVFDFDKKTRVEKEAKMIDQFVLRLQQDVAINTEVTIEDCVSSLDFAQDVRSTALGYLERAREGVG